MRSIFLAGLVAAAAGLASRSAGASPTVATQPAASAGAWMANPPPPPLAKPVPAVPAWSELELPNGLRIVAIERHGRPVVIVRLLLARGALTDPPLAAGATYLAVKLAADFHEKSESGEELLEEKSLRRKVNELGGAASFEVASDDSVAGVSGYAQDVGKYLRMLADAVQVRRHGAQSFSERRDLLLDTVEDMESSDPLAFQRVLTEAAFGPGHPYSRSVIGTIASLTPLGIEEVVAQQDQIFVPRGATLLVVGDVRADAVLADARKAFSAWRGRSTPLPSVPAVSVPVGNQAVGFLKRRPASTLVVCATRPLAERRAADATLDLLAAVLGQGTQSRLSAALRDGSGLTYGAEAEIVKRRYARALLACSRLRADRAGEGIRLFREVLASARTTPPSREELERAKAIRLAELDAAYDDAAGIAEVWEEAIAQGRGHPRLDEERAELQSVTAEAVQALAQQVLRPETIRWILSGDPRAATAAVEANQLGTLRPFSFGR
jgi:zinc protease